MRTKQVDYYEYYLNLPEETTEVEEYNYKFYDKSLATPVATTTINYGHVDGGFACRKHVCFGCGEKFTKAPGEVIYSLNVAGKNRIFCLHNCRYAFKKRVPNWRTITREELKAIFAKKQTEE